ncbi:MAG TPA: DUF2279 domain-containing protein [Patescibacteria group bacterium]|nr:DUF2279 domain-containing protein [Patescibacteria group bacterium]
MKFLKTVFALALFISPLKAQELVEVSEPVAGFKNEERTLLKNEEISFKNKLESDSTELLKREKIRAQIDSLEKQLTIKGEDGLEYVAPEDFTYAGNPRYTLVGRPLAKTQIRPVPTVLFGATAAGVVYTLHQAQSVWWTEDAEFKVIEDWDFAIQADKAGHFMGGYFFSYISHELLIACGVSRDASIWAGGLLGLSYQTYVEILDGYAKGWGFSMSDQYANTLGAGFFVLQHYVPFLQNFQPKWQYIPADWAGERPRRNLMTEGNFIDDYNSNTFWMSFNVNNMLPKSVEGYWPDWLMLSIGYGARNIETGHDAERARRVMIGLDYNLVELLPDGPNWWNWFKQSANLIKLPAPTIEFTRGITTFRFLYPFQIRL